MNLHISQEYGKCNFFLLTWRVFTCENYFKANQHLILCNFDNDNNNLNFVECAQSFNQRKLVMCKEVTFEIAHKCIKRWCGDSKVVWEAVPNGWADTLKHCSPYIACETGGTANWFLCMELRERQQCKMSYCRMMGIWVKRVCCIIKVLITRLRLMQGVLF